MSSSERTPRIRRSGVPDDALIVLRGDDLRPATARHQAEVFRRRYPDWGRWGLSAFYARNELEVDDLAADQLERFPMIDLYEASDLRAAAFEIVPTFRTPHLTLAFSGDLDEGIGRLRRAVHQARPNPYNFLGRS